MVFRAYATFSISDADFRKEKICSELVDQAQVIQKCLSR